jgi:hypothetical protein
MQSLQSLVQSSPNNDSVGHIKALGLEGVGILARARPMPALNPYYLSLVENIICLVSFEYRQPAWLIMVRRWSG